ncbi:recQ-mediated genome instability protein 1 isoform X1 [Octopus sinensis]|uniref:RecQ-mediated genome instability protein 1 n=2 Tax=Octopus sinensis TaxID=2607531 RepID=A0A6P7S9B3_9MOLL|nr:recQ-mediated genome instability protein 1 isoform X1 [Octopus sinensis]
MIITPVLDTTNSLGAIMEAVHIFLKSKHIQVPMEWLDACIDWLKEEHQGSTLSADQLKSLVYEQWLAADLTELGSQCLPQQTATSNKFFLSGFYCLQVNNIIDISTSYYTQHSKLKGTDFSNSLISAENPKQYTPQPVHCRMLKMEMTDGTTVVHGIEYKSIPSLNVNINPGFKVLIKGKILCRNGVLMLSNENISVLGGEVDSLIESNAQLLLIPKVMKEVALFAGKDMRKDFVDSDNNNKNISNRKMKELHTSNVQNKKHVYSDSSYDQACIQKKSRLYKDTSEETFDPHYNNMKDNATKMSTNLIDEFADEWDDLDFMQELDENADLNIPKKSNEKPVSQPSEISHFEENWDEDEMEVAMLNDIEFENETKPQNSDIHSSTSMAPSVTHDEISTSRLKAHQKPTSSVTSKYNKQLSTLDINSNKKKSDASQFESYNDSSTSTSNSIEHLMNKWTKLSTQSHIQSNIFPCLSKVDVHKIPFTYLFLLKAYNLQAESIKFYIKGYISTLLSRMTRANGKWQLKCMLNDGTGTLPVELSDELLTEFIGFTVEESVKMNAASASDSSLKQKLHQGLQQCQVKIVNLYNIFEIEMNQNYSHPIVTKIHPITTEILNQLQTHLATALERI